MAQHIVSLTPEQLRQQAKAYNKARDMFQEARDLVKRTNDEMAQQWRGKAYTSYLAQSEQLDGNVVEFQELLSRIYQQVNTYADTVAARDIEDSTRFGLQ